MKEFFYNARVYFSDTDAGGIVYHARYLDFAEHARTEMLREILPGIDQSDLKDDGVIFVVKSISIDYRKPALLDDLLVVRTTLEKAERFSAVFKQEVLRQDEIIASLSVRVASVSAERKRIVPIPQKVLEALQN